MRFLLYCAICSQISAFNEDIIANDYETIMDAAGAIDNEIYWTAASKLLRGCVTSANPLTVTIEYAHRNEMRPRVVQAFRPWRTFGWRIRDEHENDATGCDVSAYVTVDGRSHHIVDVTRRAWRAYATYARGFATVKPLSGADVDDYGSVVVTAVDSLDTLWLMGLRDQFYEGCAIVNASSYSRQVKVFETTIRVLGGLLSAHLLSKEMWLLERAVELGEKLLPAFKEQGMPRSDVHLKTGEALDPFWSASSLSKIALTLEFKHLSFASEDDRFANVVNKSDASMLVDALNMSYVMNASSDTIEFAKSFRLGARAGSYYESLLKEWIRSGDTQYLDAFVGATKEIDAQLHVDLHGNVGMRMDHLVCFWPGTLAMAVKEGALPKDPYLFTAQRIIRTCLNMHMPPRYLAPEITSITKMNDKQIKMEASDRYNLLRPNTLESLYSLWVESNDDYYCEWAWYLFNRIENSARVQNGYAGIVDITALTLEDSDSMPPYFFAKTLKYAWLCAEENDITSKFVFNSEAHLLQRVFK